MPEKYVDLHIHSFFSDGTMSPGEIVAEAKARNVGLIALSDHNVLEGSRQIRQLCREAGVGYIPAVELDCLDGGNGYHVLSYGADPDNPQFLDMVKRDRFLLDEMSVILIRKMSREIPGISISDFEGFSHDKRLGGWKALQYLVHKGITKTLKEGIPLYSRYDCPYTIVDFPSMQQTCKTIHQAGGFAVLAHPAENIPAENIGQFRHRLTELIETGLDGIECHYPSHSEAVTSVCTGSCRERDLIITAGSDCHGGFGRTTIGQTRTTLNEVNLKGIRPL